MTAQRGAYANRNQQHKDRRLSVLSQADGDWARMSAAFDNLRGAVRLLRRRRPPLGTPAGYHGEQADAITRDVTAYLVNLTARIDRGEFDAQKPQEVAA